MTEAMRLPRLFIASSTEGLEVAQYLQFVTQDFCDSTVWSQGIFGLSESGMDGLIEAASSHDFAAVVLTGDDLTEKRKVLAAAPRDNVIFELGLFMGARGVRRTFMVYDSDKRPDLPSDLNGINYAPYRKRADDNLRASLGPVAIEIKEAMRKEMRSMTTVINKVRDQTVETSSNNVEDPSRAIEYATDFIDSLTKGLVGLSWQQNDAEAANRWAGNLLGMLQDVYSARQADSYVVWLRPAGEPRRLGAYMHRNLADVQQHYFFGWNEGLAGKAWASNKSVVHTPEQPHDWWVFREGCENTTYLCAPVGSADDDGGLLAIGSGLGFKVTNTDLAVVSMYASLLCITKDKLID